MVHKLPRYRLKWYFFVLWYSLGRYTRN